MEGSENGPCCRKGSQNGICGIVVQVWVGGMAVLQHVKLLEAAEPSL